MPNPAPHILIMDDCPAILDLLREFLEEEGYRVTTSTTLPNVADLVALAPDCILLEWRFAHDPDAAWRYVLRLRLEPELTWAPLVLCTTADRPCTDHQIAQLLQDLQVTVVRKPCALRPLLNVMQQAMRPPSLRGLDVVEMRDPANPGIDPRGRGLQLPQLVQVVSLGQGG